MFHIVFIYLNRDRQCLAQWVLLGRSFHHVCCVLNRHNCLKWPTRDWSSNLLINGICYSLICTKTGSECFTSVTNRLLSYDELLRIFILLSFYTSFSHGVRTAALPVYLLQLTVPGKDAALFLSEPSSPRAKVDLWVKILSWISATRWKVVSIFIYLE
jgi:hypothetical protein